MPDTPGPRRSLADYRFWSLAWAALAFYRVALWLAPYRRVARLLPASRGAPAPSWASRRVRWAIAGAARRVPDATCLPQALAAHALLSLQGYSSLIRIGVRRAEAGDVQAHAWVVSGDTLVVGDDGERLEGFSPLIDLGRRG